MKGVALKDLNKEKKRKVRKEKVYAGVEEGGDSERHREGMKRELAVEGGR